MSRLVLTAVGGDPAETVRLEQDPDAERAPGPGDVVVAMEAAPVNPADFLVAAGWFSVQPVPPWPMGAEGVGRVVGTGSAPEAAALAGRRVIVLPTFEHGTWAGRVVVPAGAVVAVGEEGDVRQLAMLAVNPATAYALLHDFADLRSGDWIGLTAANSAVGQYVTALAHHLGIRTLAIVRRASGAGRLRGLGADAVVVDGPDLAERASEALGGARLRLLLDGVGGAKAAELTGLVADGGDVVSYASQTGESPAVALPDLYYRGIGVRSFFIVAWVRDTPREKLEAVYAELAGLVAKGVLRAEVEAAYPLAAFAEAFAHVRNPDRTGKILFTVDGDGER